MTQEEFDALKVGQFVELLSLALQPTGRRGKIVHIPPRGGIYVANLYPDASKPQFIDNHRRVAIAVPTGYVPSELDDLCKLYWSLDAHKQHVIKEVLCQPVGM